MPLHYIAICRQGLVSADINVSQGSVATYPRYCTIFNIHLTATLPGNLPGRKFVNRLRFDRLVVMRLWPRFSGPPCIHVHRYSNRRTALQSGNVRR